MESLSLARQSVAADVSEFARAELEVFVAARKRQRPSAWSRVEQLQQACRRESPATAAGLGRSQKVLAEQGAA
jgi:hypothetical protein